MKKIPHDIASRLGVSGIETRDGVLVPDWLARRIAQIPEAEIPAAESAHQEQQLRPPTISAMLKNFAGEVARWAAAGLPLASCETFSERLEKCRACIYWDELAFAGTGQCRHPGCGCSRAKLWLATSKCPAGRWDAVIEDRN